MIRYAVRLASLGRHHFEIACTVENPAPEQRFSLPSWTPGSYLLREYAKHVVSIRAESPDGEIALEKISKNTWCCRNRASRITVTARVFALDRSVRGAYLDARRGYFNGACLFLWPEGRESEPAEVVLERPEDPRTRNWRVATAMDPAEADPDGFGSYTAGDYDELIDHPFEIGEFVHVQFRAADVPHRLIISGRHRTDLDRIAEDLSRLCDTHIEFFGRPPPFRDYMFLGLAVGFGHGGLEHRASSSLIFSRDNLPAPGEPVVSSNYQRFLALCSHEYFHSWNVKRIKPRAFTPYRLDRRTHTRLLWVVEGVTSYYQDMMLLKSGLIDATGYLRSLGEGFTRVYQHPGRLNQSLADASFDAWDRFYKPEVNSLNANVSYYAKGALVALALDLTLRKSSEIDLDTVMRELWRRYGSGSEGMAEDAFERLVQELSGMDLEEFFESAVRGTDDLPFADLLDEFGVCLTIQQGPRSRGDQGKQSSAGPALELGIRFRQQSAGLEVVAVITDSPAERAGINPGDILIALDGMMLSEKNLQKRLTAYEAGQTVSVMGFRDEELLEFQVALAEATLSACTLSLVGKPDAAALARRKAWLGT